MAAIHYKLNYYKGCPGITILHFVLDLVGILFSIMGIGLTVYSFSNENVWKGMICAVVTVTLIFGYFKLAAILENRGRLEEAEKREQRKSFMKNASKEEIVRFAKQEKREDVLMVIGIIISIIIAVPIIAGIFVVCIMCFT